MTFLIGFFAYLIAAINLLLGVWIFIKNPKKITHISYCMLNIAYAVWAIPYGIWIFQTNEVKALFWSRMLNFGATLIPFFYFLWIVAILNILKQKKKLIYFIGFITLFFLSFSFSPYYISHTQLIEDFKYFNYSSVHLYWPQANFIYSIFLIEFFGLLIYALIILLRFYFQTQDLVLKKQIKFIILGSMFGFMGGSTNFPLMYGINLLPPIGMFIIGIQPILFVFSIIKYRLFNIRVIVSELLVFTIWIFLLFRLFLSETIKDWFINGSLLTLIVVFGILLIRSVMREVKQREKLEWLTNELKVANQKLLETDKLKTGMFSFVSHQIKTPMAVIKGFSQLLYENSYGDLPQKAKETVGHIKDACDRLINLTNDFLDLRKIEEGKMDYQFTEINIVDLVKSVIDDLRLPAQNKGLEIIFEEPKDAKIMIKADEQRLRQVIQNLIDNSIKYTEKGWIKISLESIVDNQQQKNVIIKIADSGIGISKESLPNLFDEFVRAKETRTIKGTGLGLYIAKQIIEAHQGEIWAESEGEGKGSQFYVKLKVVE